MLRAWLKAFWGMLAAPAPPQRFRAPLNVVGWWREQDAAPQVRDDTEPAPVWPFPAQPYRDDKEHVPAGERHGNSSSVDYKPGLVWHWQSKKYESPDDPPPLLAIYGEPEQPAAGPSTLRAAYDAWRSHQEARDTRRHSLHAYEEPNEPPTSG